MSAKDPFKPVHLYSQVLEMYNRLLEQTFEDRLVSAKERKLLQRIFQRLEEVSILIDEFKSNSDK